MEYSLPFNFNNNYCRIIMRPFQIIFTALYIRSGDILIMSGQSRTAFHAVPRIIKVGEENEPPACLKWQLGLFECDANTTSRAYPAESDVLDKTKKIRGVHKQEEINKGQGNYIPTTADSEESKQSRKHGLGQDFESKIIDDVKSICIEPSEVCGRNKLDFCGKSTRMGALSAEEWRRFEVYLSKTRINVNVRQVHERGKTMNSFC